MASPQILYCIGATKAGTSWLYRALAEHPGAHMRAVKELHYWDTFGETEQAWQIGAFLRRAEHFAERRQEAVAEGRERQVASLESQIVDLGALAHMLAADRDGDAAYVSYLTEGAEGRLVADITPAYGSLPVRILRRMAEVSPRAVFVYLVRDPLARLWSHVRMVAARSGVPERLGERAHNLLRRLLTRGDESDILARGDYPATAERLGAAVPASRFRVVPFEAVVEPHGYAALCRFLGLAPMTPATTRVVHAGPEVALSDDLKDKALAHLRGHYDWAARTLGPLPQAWQANLTRALA